MTTKTKNILAISALVVIFSTGVFFYMKGQHIDGKTVFGKTRTKNGVEVTGDRIDKFIKLAAFSPTALRKGIDNTPPPVVKQRLEAVAKNIYFPLVKGLGVHPVVSSGYRSYLLNKAVKGSKTSQHMTGQAIDIDLENSQADNNDIWRYIKNFLDFDQMILEFNQNGVPSWIHVSYKSPSENRRKINIARKINGKTKYYTFSENLFRSIYGQAA